MPGTEMSKLEKSPRFLSIAAVGVLPSSRVRASSSAVPLPLSRRCTPVGRERSAGGPLPPPRSTSPKKGTAAPVRPPGRPPLPQLLGSLSSSWELKAPAASTSSMMLRARPHCCPLDADPHCCPLDADLLNLEDFPARPTGAAPAAAPPPSPDKSASGQFLQSTHLHDSPHGTCPCVSRRQ